MTVAWWRIVPLLAITLLLNFLDRANISFAALQMDRALGLSNTTFGVAAGFFSIGYLVAAVPSTLALQAVGARRWMSLLMIIWGLCSAGTALISNPAELVVARVVLGAAEAGFSPGVLLYLTYWFPSEYRGRVLSSFLVILPAGLVIGGPVSSALLSWDGFLGIAGWKWVFIIEGLPAVVLAWVVFRFLPDGPDDARWLSQEQRDWLTRRLGSVAVQGQKAGWRALANMQVTSLALALLGITTSGGAAVTFLPLVIRSMGFSVGHTGLVAVLPALVAMLSVPLWGVWTDRAPRRELVAVATCSSVAVGLWGTAVLLPSAWALFPLTVAFIGYFGSVVPFWSLPPSLLTGANVAAGIAVINLAGNLGGLTGPSLMGWASDATGSYGGGITVAAAPVVVSAAILLMHAVRSIQPSVASPTEGT